MVDRVHNQVYISGLPAVQEGSIAGRVDAVIGVCQDSARDNVGKPYRHFNMADGQETVGKYGGRCNYDLFSNVAETILSHLTDGEVVHVHCHVGRSRSVSTSIAAVGVYEHEPYEEIFARFEEERAQIGPNELLEGYSKRFIEEYTDITHGPSTEFWS